MNFIPVTILAIISFFGNPDKNEKVLKQEYHDNGNLKMEYVMKSSKIVEASYYYENGQLREQGQFKGQTMHGIWKSFNETGLQIAEAKFDNGTSIKKSFWNNDGTLAGVITNNTQDQLVNLED